MGGRRETGKGPQDNSKEGQKTLERKSKAIKTQKIRLRVETFQKISKENKKDRFIMKGTFTNGGESSGPKDRSRGKSGPSNSRHGRQAR